MIGVSVIGLGNALQPHARSLVDLADRVRVVWAAASSDVRRRTLLTCVELAHMRHSLMGNHVAVIIAAGPR